MLLKQIDFKSKYSSEFPYQLPFFRIEGMPLTTPVTFIVGENGCGKSTLLELLQENLNLFRIEHETPAQRQLRQAVIQAKSSIKLTHVLHRPKGIYFGSEDFTSYIHHLADTLTEAREEIQRVEELYGSRGELVKGLAASPHARTIHDIESLYERDLLKASHGEAYLAFFASRIRDQYLYVLDEPETPLSIQNQLTLMVHMHEAVKRGGQFIIATHSPVLLAYPGATIWEITAQGISIKAYDQLDQVQLMKQFLQAPEAFFHHMFEDR